MFSSHTALFKSRLDLFIILLSVCVQLCLHMGACARESQIWKPGVLSISILLSFGQESLSPTLSDWIE